MALICMVGPQALSMQMSLQGEKDNLKNKLLLKLQYSHICSHIGVLQQMVLCTGTEQLLHNCMIDTTLIN